MAKLEIHKKIRKWIQRMGVRRFFIATILILAGLIWKFIQLTGDTSNGLTQQKLLSFWPLFWALWMGSGFIWWLLSGFKSVNGLIFSFVGGAFLAETAMPGVVINMENWPLFVILVGLFIFALPRKNYITSAYSYGNTKNFYSMTNTSNENKSRRSRRDNGSSNSETNSESNE